MKKKISIIVLCLMLLTIALAGAAEGKQKAEILNKKPLLMYCPEEGKDDPEFDAYESFYFEIQPAGKYDLQVEYAEGDEALFEAISARQYRKDDKSVYIDAEVFPKEPCVTKCRLTGESEDAYIDELFEIQVVPYTGRVTQERVDVQVQTGETVHLWEACFEELAGENSPISARYFNVTDTDKATPEKPSDRKISWEVKEPEFAEFVRISNEGVVNVQAKCPSGKMTVLAKADGPLPDQEVKAEIIIEITGK